MVNEGSVVYDLFGHRIELRCASEAIIESLTHKESCWKPLLTSPSSRDADVVVDVIQHRPPSPMTAVQHFSNANFFFHGSRSRLITGYLSARPWQVHVQSYVEDDVATLDNMILPALNTILLRLGLANVHCAAVARSGHGMLLIGPSQSGKSTTSLLLARAGMDFVSDNDVYLRRSARGVRAMSSNPELFLLDDAIERFPELELARDAPIRHRGRTAKRVLDMARAMPDRCASEAEVHVVVFPRVGDAAATTVKPVDAATCLGWLLEQVPARGLPAMIKDEIAIRGLFDLLARVSTTATIYQATLGSDPSGVVAELDSLLSG